MKYTEEEAKALLKVMGFELKEEPMWLGEPDSYFKYAAIDVDGDEDFYGDTYVEVLDKAIKYMESTNEQ